MVITEENKAVQVTNKYFTIVCNFFYPTIAHNFLIVKQIFSVK